MSDSVGEDPWEHSLGDFSKRLSRQGSRRKALSERSRRTYLEDARRLARWLAGAGVGRPEEVTTSALETAMRELEWSPATRARAIVASREWLAPHHPEGRNPADSLERPRIAPPPAARLSQQEADGLLAAIDPTSARTERERAMALRDRALLEVLYGSGLRRQEACDLDRRSVDFEHELLRVHGKGGHARTVPLTEPAVAALRAWLSDGRPHLVTEAPSEPALFVSRSGRRLDGSTVYRIVARRLRAAGRGGGPHALRHAAATHLLEGRGEGGAHLRVVQQVLGHASIATTQRYTGVTTKTMQEQLRRGHPRG